MTFSMEILGLDKWGCKVDFKALQQSTFDGCLGLIPQVTVNLVQVYRLRITQDGRRGIGNKW